MTASVPASRIQPFTLKFQVGEKTVAYVTRGIQPIAFSLSDILEGKASADDFSGNIDAAGAIVRSLPVDQLARLRAAKGGFILYEREVYPRYYTDLSGSFDSYMDSLSSKVRSQLRRKVRKFEAHCGGQLDIRSYHDAERLAEFFPLALSVSRHTYQDRLLDAGLPADRAFQDNALRAAAAGKVRAWLLFDAGKPVSYLYCPVEAGNYVYAYLGYLPDYGSHSVGTVLQVEAFQELFAEEGRRLFDFTPGEGQHKRQFATGSVDCADVLLLPRTTGNRMLIAAHRRFQGLTDAAGSMAERLGVKSRLKKLLRGG